MAIDKSGKWWNGSDAEDLREYLTAYSEDGGVLGCYGDWKTDYSPSLQLMDSE